MNASEASSTRKEAVLPLFLRFLRFGLHAWGGPVAQIAMIRQELVEEEKWVSPERFNRTLALYQVLPGPEAHELCVWFGMTANGRLGGFLAGLGFMLPGFLFMLTLSWIYGRYGLSSPVLQAAFAGVQAAVGALIVRALHRLGGHALTSRPLVVVGVLSAALSLLGLHFLPTLLVLGFAYVLYVRGQASMAFALAGLLLLWAVGLQLFSGAPAAPIAETPLAQEGATSLELFFSGLRSGLLTFGGAYTVIPFLQHDAVVAHGWLTNPQFLDGLGLSGALPAPLIIFATFVGYLTGGLPGGLAMTVGIFLPAFSFTLLGHEYLERIVHAPRLHAFLDGVTAAVIGLMAATTVHLLLSGLTSLGALLLFYLALFTLFRFKRALVAPAVVIGAGVVGAFIF